MEGMDSEVIGHSMATRLLRASIAKRREFSRKGRLRFGESSARRFGRPRGELAVRVYRESLVGTARCAVRRMSLQLTNGNSRTPQRGVPTYFPSSSASAFAS